MVYIDINETYSILLPVDFCRRFHLNVQRRSYINLRHHIFPRLLAATSHNQAPSGGVDLFNLIIDIYIMVFYFQPVSVAENNNDGSLEMVFIDILVFYLRQVSVADINNDGSLEMVFIDTSGNVQCANAAGKIIWEAEISGNSSPGSRIADINNDNIPDVIIPTDDG